MCLITSGTEELVQLKHTNVFMDTVSQLQYCSHDSFHPNTFAELKSRVRCGTRLDRRLLRVRRHTRVWFTHPILLYLPSQVDMTPCMWLNLPGLPFPFCFRVGVRRGTRLGIYTAHNQKLELGKDMSMFANNAMLGGGIRVREERSKEDQRH